MSGNGSSPRPYSVPKETFDQSFDQIFGITCKRCGKKGLLPDSIHTCSPQIKEAYLQWLSTANDADFVTLETAWTAGYQARDRELRAELEAAKNDAERYRWLRDTDGSGFIWAVNCTENHLDAAIDQAIKEKP